MGGMVIHTIFLIGTALLMMRRWRVPFGVFTLCLLGYGLMFSIVSEYEDIILVIPLVLTGLALDFLQQRLARGPENRLTLGQIRWVGPAAAFVLSLTYYVTVAIREGLGWSEATITGRDHRRHDGGLRRGVLHRAARLRPPPRRGRRHAGAGGLGQERQQPGRLAVRSWSAVVIWSLCDQK